MSYRFKNRFYRLLRLNKDERGAIKFFNEIKKKMLGDLDSQGHYRKKRGIK